MIKNDILEKYPSIYNAEEKLLFIDQTYGHLDDGKITDYIRIFHNTGKVESFLDKDIAKFSITNFVFLFERMGWISAGTFSVRKTLFETYLDWCVRNGKVEYKNLENIKLINNKDIIGNLVFKVSHFKDLDELFEANKAIRENELSFARIIDETSLIFSEIVTYLCWFRLNLEEIANLKKEDVDFEKGELKVNDRIIKLPDKIIDRIKISTETRAYSYSHYNNVLTREYVSSPYLIKSIKTDQHTQNSVRQLLVRYSELSGNLNLASDYYNKDFKFNDLYRSSLYADIYSKEIEYNFRIKDLKYGKRKKILTDLFPNEKITSTIMADFLKWRNYFYEA